MLSLKIIGEKMPVPGRRGD